MERAELQRPISTIGHSIVRNSLTYQTRRNWLYTEVQISPGCARQFSSIGWQLRRTWCTCGVYRASPFNWRNCVIQRILNRSVGREKCISACYATRYWQDLGRTSQYRGNSARKWASLQTSKIPLPVAASSEVVVCEFGVFIGHGRISPFKIFIFPLYQRYYGVPDIYRHEFFEDFADAHGIQLQFSGMEAQNSIGTG